MPGQKRGHGDLDVGEVEGPKRKREIASGEDDVDKNAGTQASGTYSDKGAVR